MDTMTMQFLKKSCDKFMKISLEEKTSFFSFTFNFGMISDLHKNHETEHCSTYCFLYFCNSSAAINNLMRVYFHIVWRYMFKVNPDK